MQLSRTVSTTGSAGRDSLAPLVMPSVLSGDVLAPARKAPSDPALAERLGRERTTPYWLLLTLACVVMIRVLVFAAGLVSTETATTFHAFATGQAWLAFDSEHYLDILRYGYPRDGIPPDIAFFPLLPLLGRLLGPYFDPGPALLVIANASTLIGFAFFFEWARVLTSRRTAFWACILLATFPTAAFFSAGMTEGPFMMCVAITLFLLQRQSYLTAALVCGVATALRPTGVALAIVVLLGYWLDHLRLTCPALFETGGCPRLRDRLRLAAAATASPRLLGWLTLLGMLSTFGITAYQCYLWQRYDRFDVYFQAQTYWEPGGLRTANQLRAEAELVAAGAVPVPRDFSYYSAKALTPQAWNRGLMWGIVLLTAWGLLRPTRIPWALFALPALIFLMSYLPAWGARASSIARFQTAALPCFVLAAMLLLTWRRPRLLIAVAGVQFAVQIYYAFLFSRGVWIG